MLRKIRIFLVFIVAVILPTISVYCCGFWETVGALTIFIIMHYLFQEALSKSNEKGGIKE